MNHVFVYGTLKQGFGNHRVIQAEATQFVGNAVTVRPYNMKDGGFPAVLDTNAGHPIKGELYEVDDATLKRLDFLEGHPDLFERREISVDIENSGVHQTAWLYFGNVNYFNNRQDVQPENGVLDWQGNRRTS